MATKRWLGAAVAVAQKTTVTIGGTWANTEAVSLICNGNTLTVTLSTAAAASTSTVAAALHAAINASDTTTGLTNGETRNLGGQQINEFKDFSATVSGAVITLTGTTRGKPFTVTGAEGSASGTITLATPTVATGPNHFDNANNWEGGALPVANDTILFDSGSVGVLYGLDYLLANTVAISLEITGDYTGQIGLPQYDVSKGYAEYRKRYLELYNTGINSNFVRFTRGVQGLDNHSSIRLYCGGAAAAWTDLVSAAVRGSAAGTPNIFIRGGTFGDINVIAGRVEFDPPEAQGLSGALVAETSLLIGSASAAEEALLICNTPTDLDACEEIRILGGTAHFRCDVDYGGVGSDSFDIHGGTVHLDPPSGGLALRDMTVHGGVLYPNHNSGSGSKVTIFKGTVDMRQSALRRNYDRVVMYGGAYYDPDGLGSSEINLVGCDLSTVTLSIPKNRKLTLGAVTT